MPTAGDQPDAPQQGDAAASPASGKAPGQGATGADAATPAGRYGPPAGRSDDRGLKIVGGVLGVLFLAFIAWSGISYIGKQDVTGELTGFTVVSDTEVEVTLQVRKADGTPAVCTVRSQAEDGLEVGRVDFRFEAEGATVHRAHTLRTTELATSAELLSCSAGD
ncbi:DUF4307 domain-containing protein [Streptomyces spiramenti]|uniref:DUF4307 domain-containing protein n=1 Tax=Streptomyces spiramenti TaxID=2720606 RepID=A0ABX1APJ4_9ACTN|nr:DUF4307 domain-containing protein [Streptomyces spiramenti]NJP67631.1 DUF4307 domain-containing protein [Streptomyces spiramenti]